MKFRVSLWASAASLELRVVQAPLLWYQITALYSSPLMFSWSKATALVSLSQRIHSLVWHSQKFNFFTPALFPTAFSPVFTISCCTASAPRVYHWRGIMSSHEKGRIFLSLTCCHLIYPECLPSLQLPAQKCSCPLYASLSHLPAPCGALEYPKASQRLLDSHLWWLH